MVAAQLEHGIGFVPTRATHRRAARELRRARKAAITPFLVLGVAFPTYFVRIPSLKLQLGLSNEAMGLLLTVPALAAVLAMQVAGPLVARFGSSAVLRVVMTALPLAMLGLPLSGGVAAAAAVLAVVGALDGLVGVGMNTHAVTVERRLGRPIMSGCHAAYSLAAVATATLGGLALSASTAPATHFTIAAAIAVPLALAGGRAMLPAAADRVPAGVGHPTDRDGGAAADGGNGGNGGDGGGGSGPDGRGPRGLAGWTPRVVLLGAMATVVLVGESAVGSWSGIYLRDSLEATLAAASAGYIGFSACHAGGRLVGDRLESRLGPAAMVQGGALVACTGLATVVVSPVLPLTVAGFALLGLGLSVLLPVVLRIAGHEGADERRGGAARTLSIVGTMSYAGMLLGPVVVGWLSQWLGLRETFAGLLLMLAVVLVVGRRAAAPARVVGPVGPAVGTAVGPVR